MASKQLAVLLMMLAEVLLLAVPAVSAAAADGRHSAQSQQQRRALTAFGLSSSRPSSSYSTRPSSSYSSYSRPPSTYRPPTRSSSGMSGLSSLFKRPATATTAGSAAFMGTAAAARPPSKMPFKLPKSHGRKPPRTGAAAGMVPAGLARPGFVATALVLPFAVGMLGAAAASSLSRSNSAYCNGRDLTCYKAVCRAALQSKCPEAAAEHNMTLVAVPCANSKYSECWSTPTPPTDDGTVSSVFDCVGVRRPKYGKTDVTALCHLREGSEGAEEVVDDSTTATTAPATAANGLPTTSWGAKDAAANSAVSSNLQVRVVRMD
jgi:hypothetical protein